MTKKETSFESRLTAKYGGLAASDYSQKTLLPVCHVPNFSVRPSTPGRPTSLLVS